MVGMGIEFGLSIFVAAGIGKMIFPASLRMLGYQKKEKIKDLPDEEVAPIDDNLGDDY